MRSRGRMGARRTGALTTKNNHEKNLEQKAAWSGVLGEWDAANEPHRAVYVPKKVYRHRGAPTTMAQAGRGIALPGE